jgi:N-acetylglucosamine-6-phosphate deacetylase
VSAAACGVTYLSSLALAQVGPVNGMRDAAPGPQALVGATVHVKPGTVLEKATILVVDGRIAKVGDASLALPEGTRIWPCDGLVVASAFVEPAYLVDSAAAQQSIATTRGAHWNRKVTPQLRADGLPPLSRDAREAMRGLGFATVHIVPEDGIVRGRGAVSLLDDDQARAAVLDDDTWLVVASEYGGDWGTATYPGALIGALALERQTFRDARWYADAMRAIAADPTGNPPPIDAPALAALADVLERNASVLFDGNDEKDLLRQARIAKEFGLPAILLGSGTEFRRIDQFAALGMPVLVPPRYPRTPDVSTPARAEALSLRDLWTWELAPTNAARLVRAGVPVAFTTAKLESRTDFRALVRTAIEHGLSEDDALAALTTRPAEFLGQSANLGTIEPGKLANLVVVDGPLFGSLDKDPGDIRAVFVAGKRHDVRPGPVFSIDGRARLVVERAGDAPLVLDAQLDREEGTLLVVLPDGSRTSIKPFRIDGDRFACTLDGAVLGVAPPEKATPATTTFRAGGTAIDGRASATAERSDGLVVRFRLEQAEGDPLPPEEAKIDPAKTPEEAAAIRAEAKAKADAAKAEERARLEARLAAKRALADKPTPFPFGEYGLFERPVAQSVLFRNATVWTATDRGNLANTDLLIVDGAIAAIGRELAAPPKVLVVDATGRHLTPGLIDCHSHTGIDGGVNEWTQTNTAEVAIADAIDPERVSWYRQLAGGISAVNQLHGSANPIGGQNSVVKVRWGESEERFPIEGAIPGIKFALGENVVRSQGRYPDTRMGVEAYLRDAFDAARRHDALVAAWKALPEERRAKTVPPRPERELEVLAEILRGERLIHCHSYRQDEILMLLRLAEANGFRIGTLQHVLEGFKVADEIARHGAGASSFSDWWAYKMEVYDAIPHNGSIMERVGVLTSFNSDSDELARRMNMEAAKAVRYGGLPPEEAIKFVTINPAKQLRIDDRVGSLEVGKDGDVVLWSADPLSVYARVDETWIEGVRRFDRSSDAARVEAMRVERQRLLTKALELKDDEKLAARKEREKQEDAGVGPGARRSLLVRMLDDREAWYFEQERLGRDVNAARPGDCGCGVLFGGNAGAAGGVR